MFELGKWYIAKDKYEDDDSTYLNYFFKIGKNMEYLSVELIGHHTQLIKEKYHEFKDNIEDNYHLEDYELTNDHMYKIIERSII